MKKVLFGVILASTVGWSVHGAISVGPGGSGVITFATAPAVTNGWSTLTNMGASADIGDAATLAALVNTNVAGQINMTLPSTATVSPSISSQNMFRYNSTLQLVQSVPTGVGYTTLMATLQNDTGSDQTSLNITYDLGELNAASTTVAEELPGFHVYFSLSGAAGSWTEIPALAGDTLGTVSANVSLGNTWFSGTPMYVLWADDNAVADRNNSGNEEGGYTIDNISFGPHVDNFNFVDITGPTNNASVPQGVPITINASAFMVNGVTNVAFFSGGSLIGNDPASPYSVVYSNAPLGTNFLTATATDTFGNTVGSTSVVRVIVVSNIPPTVTITNPVNGQSFFVGENITNQVTVADSDGVVVSVDFYVDGVFRHTDAAAPFRFELCDALAGFHTVLAVAVDNGGKRGSNSVSITVTNPPNTAIIVANGGIWKYLDDGSDQGTSWRSPAFDDSSWPSGQAELGYGDVSENRPEHTVVNFGGNPNLRFPTTYFRRSFNLPDPSAFTNYILRVLRDDTAIVYLNGVEVYRDTTNAVVDYSTYAGPQAGDDGTIYQVASIPVALLAAGQNTFAVEIHQSAANSSDISFDLMLWAQPGGPASPLLDISRAGTNVQVMWSPSDWRLQATTSLGDSGTPIQWSDVPATSPAILPAPLGKRFFRTVSADGTLCSPNVVGYLTRTVPAGFSLIANPFNLANNHLNTILPAVPDGSVISRWQVPVQGYGQPIQYDSGLGGWFSNDPGETYILNPGEGFSFQNPAAAFNVTFIGQAIVGNITNQIPANRSLLGSKIPQVQPVHLLLCSLPDNLTVSLFNGSSFDDYTYDLTIGAWFPSEPSIPVGVGFFVNNPGSLQNCARSFQIPCGPPPTIVQHPQSQTVLAGNNVTFSVVATGSPPISYQWFYKGNIPGATGSNYTILSAQLTNSGNYFVTVANVAGSVQSSNATLKVYGPIVINEWLAINNGAGGVDPADGIPSPWFELYNTGNSTQSLGGYALTDSLANSNKFVISAGTTIAPHGYLRFWADNQPAQGPDHVNFTLQSTGGVIGLYSAAPRVLMDSVAFGQQQTNISQGRFPDGSTNVVALGAPTPAAANTLSNNAAPLITANPTNQTVNCYGTATFTVQASGTAPLHYQWVRNGCDSIPGANSATLTVSNVNLSDVGNYACVITNAFGQVTSDDAALSVNASPTFPKLTMIEGTNLLFSWPVGCSDYMLQAAASLNPPIVWRGAGGDIGLNGTNVVMTLPLSADQRFFRLSASATRITGQPKGRAVTVPATVTLSVTATSSVPLSYQWRHNGRLIPGQTSNTLVFDVVSNANFGAYEAFVTDNERAQGTEPAFIRPAGLEAQLADQLAARKTETNLSGSIHGTTAGATAEAGEPQHAGVPGGKSVWFSWRPSATGIATFDTVGSCFDTLLAVYQGGSNFATLAPIVSDDDLGGFLWSKVIFNAVSNTEYAIAIDGAGGTSGFFMLNWNLEVTPGTVPVIAQQPQEQVVQPNQQATFSVGVSSPPPLTYQWFRNNLAIAGANAPDFVIPSAANNDVAEYYVTVANSGRLVESRRVGLQLSANPAEFKFDSKILADFLCGGTGIPGLPDFTGKAVHAKVISPSTTGPLTGSLSSYSPVSISSLCATADSYKSVYIVNASCGSPKTATTLTLSVTSSSGNALVYAYVPSVTSPIVACASGVNPSTSFEWTKAKGCTIIVGSASGATVTLTYANSSCH